MHVPSKSKSTRHSPIEDPRKPTEMPRESLSYTNNMLMTANGTLLRQDEIQEMREKQGYCPTCKGTPVKLYEVRKTKLNPLWKSKEPLTVANESHKGVCLKCHPLDEDQKRASIMSEGTEQTSSRSAFVGGKLTVTKYEDSQRSGNLLEEREGSFQTARVSDSMISTLSQEQSFTTAQQQLDFSSSSLLGTSADPLAMAMSDSLLRKSNTSTKPSASVEPEAFRRRQTTPPLVLSGIPADARNDPRNDSLNVSRRNSVPIPSGPELAAASAAKKPPPSAVVDKEQQEILNALNNSSRVNRGSGNYKSMAKKPPPRTSKPKKNASGGRHQAADTMDRLRAAYERTFHSTSMDDEISAITIDIEHQTSLEAGRNNSGGFSVDSDSLLEEFSVPDFSMGTDAVKSYRGSKPSKGKNMLPQQKQAPLPTVLSDQDLRMAAAFEARRRTVDIPRKPTTFKGAVAAAIDPSEMSEVPRKPFVLGSYNRDEDCKPKAEMTRKPAATKPRAAAAVAPTMNEPGTSRNYAMLDSGVSAIPGPPAKLDSVPRMKDPPLEPPPAMDKVSTKYGYPSSMYPATNDIQGLARVPSTEESTGTSLAPPSLVDSSGTVGELTVETKTSGDLVSKDCKVEEVACLINDVVAAENSEFLVELLSNTMRTHQERVDVQALCLQTIWDMSKYNDENKNIIMANGLYECVIAAMKDFPNSVDVQSSGCGALWSLSVNQFNRVILVRAGACERILRGLDTHLNNERFVEIAFGALRTLSPEPEARLVINHMLGNQRVVRAMGLHRFVVDVQRDGCAFLSNVAVDMHNQEVSVVSREELQAVVRAMRDHLKNESVVTSACFALKNFSYEEMNLRNLRMFDDVVALFEDAAQYATKASCRRDAAEVLKRIQLLQTEDTALEETAFSSLMQAMRRASTEKNPAKQVEESVATVTEVLQEYYWSVRLICFCFESLISLADTSEAHLSRILSPKTLRVVVNTMKEHVTNARVQQRGCELLRALAEPNKPANRMEICMEEGCSVIVTALRNHRSDESVEIPAFAALQYLAEEPMCAEEIQRCGGWQIIREHESEVSSIPISSETEAALGDGLEAPGAVAVAPSEVPALAKSPPE